MRTPLWLAWRELARRRGALLVAVGTLAALVALCVAVELLARARESSLAAAADNLGPGLLVTLPGTTSRDLAAGTPGPASLAVEVAARLRREPAGAITAVDGRLLLRLAVAGRPTPVLGVEPREVRSPFGELRRLGQRETALGVELARGLGKRRGDLLTIEGHDFAVAAVLPSSGTPEDVAAFVPLRRSQEIAGAPGAVNVLQVYPRPATDLAALAADLRARHPGLAILSTGRGEPAEAEMSRSVARHRVAVYATVALAVAICLLVWSHLNASERRRELAILVAVGARASTLMALLMARGALVGIGGGLAGYLLGMAVALARDPQAAAHVAWAPDLLVLAPVAAAMLSVLGTLPVAIGGSFREHVRALQD